MKRRRSRRGRTPRKFAMATFGPWALRPLLRSNLERHEHVVGWGIVQPVTSAFSKFSAAVMPMVPVFGPLVGAVLMTSMTKRRRVAILTDRRLMLVRADAKRLTQAAVVFNEPLAVLEFEVVGASASEQASLLIHYGGLLPAAIEVVESSSPAAERLKEALFALAVLSQRDLEELGRG